MLHCRLEQLLDCVSVPPDDDGCVSRLDDELYEVDGSGLSPRVEADDSEAFPHDTGKSSPGVFWLQLIGKSSPGVEPLFTELRPWWGRSPWMIGEGNAAPDSTAVIC